ncbi:hypothetical protein XA68_12263 [Ophiocordyceps unilateralis]|uniref:Heterokaryon incompatibility domain-containing protein n=1 Tax=Ophiocordyceps unilateralis TaxID=268505 RepID=A0A2A9PF28_OPHUN|nr:hypothetical protein XA68_12263 [Ophiocordyceps unilateralis]
MRLTTSLFVLLSYAIGFPESVMGFAEVSRCLRYDDSRLSRAFDGFFHNASACLSIVHGPRVLPCATKHIPEDMTPFTLPLTDTIQAWEKYYDEDLDSAFQEHGNPALDGRSKINAWDVLIAYWQRKTELCFQYRDPESRDSLVPRNAGLLTLFHMNDDLARPILKMGMQWRYSDFTVCADDDSAGRNRQMRVVSEMMRRSITWRETRNGVELNDGYLHYLDLFSTDPFLQAVITGWQSSRLMSCPRGYDCISPPTLGMRHLPMDGDGFLMKVKAVLQTENKVCVVTKGSSSLAQDTYYILSPIQFQRR